MVSLEKRLAIAESELKKRGVKNVSRLLESGVDEPASFTKKNNGVLDNINESNRQRANSDGQKTSREKLLATLKECGFSALEAKIMAGIGDEDQGVRENTISNDSRDREMRAWVESIKE